MTSFLLAVLASNLFWVIYAVTSFTAMVIIMRMWGKTELKALISGKEPPNNPGVITSGGIMCAIFFVFWPLIAVAAVIRYTFIVLFKLGLGFLRVALTGADKIVPNFEIKVNKKD